MLQHVLVTRGRWPPHGRRDGRCWRGRSTGRRPRTRRRGPRRRRHHQRSADLIGVMAKRVCGGEADAFRDLPSPKARDRAAGFRFRRRLANLTIRSPTPTRRLATLSADAPLPTLAVLACTVALFVHSPRRAGGRDDAADDHHHADDRDDADHDRAARRRPEADPAGSDDRRTCSSAASRAPRPQARRDSGSTKAMTLVVSPTGRSVPARRARRERILRKA